MQTSRSTKKCRSNQIDYNSEEWRTLKEGDHFGYALGEFLGFPKCCSDEFLNLLDNDIPALKLKHQKLINHPCKGTGFVPCNKCMDRNPQELIDNINANRTFPHPFPFKGSILGTASELFEEYLKNYERKYND